MTPKSTYPPGLPHHPRELLVDVPVGTAGLDTTRIALSRSAVSIDYFADSEWTNPVPLLVQTALLESFENSRTLAAIDRDLLRRCLHHEPGAWNDFVDRFLGLVYHVVGHTADQDEAE